MGASKPSSRSRPGAACCSALRALGFEPGDLTRASLRAIIHASTGMPPDARLSNDELAAEIIRLHERRLLHWPLTRLDGEDRT